MQNGLKPNYTELLEQNWMKTPEDKAFVDHLRTLYNTDEEVYHFLESFA